MKTLIFLGAGASADDGAPLQNEFFKEYLKNKELVKKLKIVNCDLLDSFFKKVFGLNLNGKNDQFPSFEEILGITDLAEKNNEVFVNFDLGHVKENLINLMAAILYLTLKNSNGKYHRELIENLKKLDYL